MKATQEFGIAVSSHGLDDGTGVEYAKERVRAAAGHASQPVTFARLKLKEEPHRSIEDRAQVEAMLDLSGLAVRARAAAPTIHEAANLLQQRLSRKLDSLDRRKELVRRLRAGDSAGEWRHESVPSERPDYFPRPVDERKVVRHKSFSFGSLTPEDALAEMESLEHDFHLYADRETGRDAVVFRRQEGGYALSRAGGIATPPVGFEEGPEPPEMELAEAENRLGLSEEPFLFFIDAATGRGNVLYLRYDGHYGLITPAR